MTHYDSYQSNAAQAPVMRKWLIFGFVVSLLLHTALFVFFQMKKLENFAVPGAERLAPPLRAFKQVRIPPPPKEAEETRVKIEDKPLVNRIAVPSDKPQVEDVLLAPQMPDLPKPIVNEKPKADTSGADLLAKVAAQSRGDQERGLSSLASALIRDTPKNPRQPRLTLPSTSRVGNGGVGDREGIPGLKTIDEALAGTGQMSAGDKPIGMPGGALYEYDSADLQPGAIEQLRKLGELIRRNPKATFSIEGHSDATGDAAYNQRLSERRAEAVRDWLVLSMQIPPDRIQTKGYGSSRLIVPADRSVEEQAPNRRVEIVIKTGRR